MQAIETKKTLADCVVDGVLMNTDRINQAELYKSSRRELDSLIASLNKDKAA